MVVVGTDACTFEFVTDLLGPHAGTHIHDGCSRYRAQDMDKFSDLFLGGTHDIGQVLTGETHREDIRDLKAKAPLYVFHNDGCCRCRQRQHGNAREKFPHLGDTQERRSEVVAPLRDAVCLVHDNERDWHLAQALHKRARLQPFRRHIEELAVAIEALLVGAVDLGSREAGIQVGRFYAQGPQAVHLVLHQRDDGCDNEGHAIHSHRWNLKCNGLAATRGHQP